MRSGNVHGEEQRRHLTNHLQSLLQIPNGVRIFRMDRQPIWLDLAQLLTNATVIHKKNSFTAPKGEVNLIL